MAEVGAAAGALLPLTAEDSSLIAPFTIPLSAFIAMFPRSGVRVVTAAAHAHETSAASERTPRNVSMEPQ